MSSSNSPSADCKLLRQILANISKVYGVSNVAKYLRELNPAQRKDAVKSLAYEAEARLQDPVYGCVEFISVLQHKLKQAQYDIDHAKNELAKLATFPLSDPGLIQQNLPNMGVLQQCNMQPMMALQQENQQQMVDQAQQLAVAEAAMELQPERGENEEAA